MVSYSGAEHEKYLYHHGPKLGLVTVKRLSVTLREKKEKRRKRHTKLMKNHLIFKKFLSEGQWFTGFFLCLSQND